MQRFFNDFDSLDRFTLSLDSQQDALQCPHCTKNNQLVSHGLIYRQNSIEVKEAIGKRVFCSNRYQHSGCGRTLQLYIEKIIPHIQYETSHLFVFLSSLLLNLTVEAAYQQATNQLETRNAWRWLNKLDRNLMHFRCAINNRTEMIGAHLLGRSRRLQLLLPTLKQLFSQLQSSHISNYQASCQSAFI